MLFALCFVLQQWGIEGSWEDHRLINSNGSLALGIPSGRMRSHTDQLMHFYSMFANKNGGLAPRRGCALAVVDLDIMRQQQAVVA